MGDMNGEPLYCPLCGTLPDANLNPKRVCISCGQSMKDIRWLSADDVAALRLVVDRVDTTDYAGNALMVEAMARLAALIGDGE